MINSLVYLVPIAIHTQQIILHGGQILPWDLVYMCIHVQIMTDYSNSTFFPNSDKKYCVFGGAWCLKWFLMKGAWRWTTTHVCLIWLCSHAMQSLSIKLFSESNTSFSTFSPY